jgi:isoleucyl-tRNA synthetase
MDTVRDVASAGLALRKAHGLRVRLPLSVLRVITPVAHQILDFVDIIASELNVKVVTSDPLDDDKAALYGIGKRLLPNARVLGPRIGRKIQAVITAAKAGDWSETNGLITVGGIDLEPGEYELELTSTSAEQAVAFLASGGFVVLDTTLTPELTQEGMARDIIRWVQQERKNAGLDVSDRISLELGADEHATMAIEAHRGLIQAETLALDLELGVLDSKLEALSVGENSQITVKVSAREY